jgi:hypothetical protein
MSGFEIADNYCFEPIAFQLFGYISREMAAIQKTLDKKTHLSKSQMSHLAVIHDRYKCLEHEYPKFFMRLEADMERLMRYKPVPPNNDKVAGLLGGEKHEREEEEEPKEVKKEVIELAGESDKEFTPPPPGTSPYCLREQVEVDEHGEKKGIDMMEF